MESEATPIPGPPEPKISPRYRKLKKLYVQGPVKVVDTLLHCVASTMLEDLTIKPQATRNVTNGLDLWACTKILRWRTNMQGSLKRLTFDAQLRVTGAYYASYHRDPLIPSSELEAIRDLCNLEYLEFGNGMSGTQDFILSTVAHLPRMVECVIPLSSTPAMITVFHTLAKSCPNLTRLQLPIQVDDGFPEFDPLIFTPTKHCLQHLAVSDWSPYSYDRQKFFLATRHLNAAFPYLRVMNGGGGWTEVMAILGTIQDIVRRG
jgi:hypothetical protein